jgi:two-component sensor histidine kinase
VDAETLNIDADRAVPMGLLINELATNAIKHAFPQGVGEVRLTARGFADRMELTVADDGVGMSPAAIDDEPQARGSDYIGIFVRQLGGELTTSSAKEAGTIVTICLPVETA